MPKNHDTDEDDMPENRARRSETICTSSFGKVAAASLSERVFTDYFFLRFAEIIGATLGNGGLRKLLLRCDTKGCDLVKSLRRAAGCRIVSRSIHQRPQGNRNGEVYGV